MIPWIVKDFGEEPEGRPGGLGMETSQVQLFHKDLRQRKFGGPLDIWYHICRLKILVAGKSGSITFLGQMDSAS